MNRLCRTRFVEEANLTFNIQQLRKSLQDNARKPVYIETIARRGYRFIATVEEASRDDGWTGGQTTERFQIPETRSGEGREVESEACGVRPEAELPDTNNPAAPETNINPTPTTNVVSTRQGKKTAVIVLTSVIVVACIGALIWRLSAPTKEGPNDSRRTDGESAVGLPLKIEKLTLTGQSRLAAISPDGKYVAYTRAIKSRAVIWLRQVQRRSDLIRCLL